MRIQLELSKDRANELESLMIEKQIKTKKELIENALALLEWAIREAKEGKIIVSVEKDGKNIKEVVMPILR